MSQTVGWAEFMYLANKTRGPGLEPDYDSDKKQFLFVTYYIFYIVFGAFFITNLFVGVVISTYNREKDRLPKYRQNRLKVLPCCFGMK